MDTPQFWEISLHRHTWLCVCQLRICFPSCIPKVPHTPVLFHIAFMLLGCKGRIAKDSVQCGCDLGPLPLVATESGFIWPGAWWKVWEMWPNWWGGCKMQQEALSQVSWILGFRSCLGMLLCPQELRWVIFDPADSQLSQHIASGLWSEWIALKSSCIQFCF